MTTTPPNASDIKTWSGEEIARHIRNLDETSYNEGSSDLACRCADSLDVIRQLQRQIAEAGKDADRYRWLVAYGSTFGWDNESIDRQIAIDKALKGQTND